MHSMPFHFRECFTFLEGRLQLDSWNFHHVLPDGTETRPAMVKIARFRSTLAALHLIVSGLLILPTAVISAEPAARSAGGSRESGKPPRERTGSPRKLLDQFDADKNGRLDAAERRAAREFLNEEPRMATTAAGAILCGSTRNRRNPGSNSSPRA